MSGGPAKPPAKRAWNRLASDVDARLVELYASGLSLEAAGRAAGLSVSAVRRAVREAPGVRVRTPADACALRDQRRRLVAVPPGTSIGWGPEERAAVVAGYAEGYSHGALARKFGRGASLIARVLRFEGVKPRTQAEAIAAWKARLARERDSK